MLAICDFHNTFSILDPKVQPKGAPDLLVPPGQFPGLRPFVVELFWNFLFCRSLSWEFTSPAGT